MLRIAVVVGSTRPGRRSEQVARWVHQAAQEFARRRCDLEFELVDLAEVGLPMLDEPVPAAIGGYRHEHTRRWARIVDSFDGFIFVTPEYNHAVPPVLLNAIDYLFGEWNDKAAGFVSYGLNGGVRAVEQLRLTLAEVKVACVRNQVVLSLFADFDIPDMRETGRFAPAPHHREALDRLFEDLMAWAVALQALRTPSAVASRR